MREDLDLACGRAAAVAAHGRQDQGPATSLLNRFRNRPKHLGHAAHPPAAGRDQHGLPGNNFLQPPGPADFIAYDRIDVDIANLLKTLLGDVELREIHVHMRLFGLTAHQ
jgi:hypothetical protein